MADHSSVLLRAERLTLAVLMCGVGALALSDFVSPFYWGLSVVAALLRLSLGPRFHLSEMQASMIGWLGFIWVALELLLGRELIVAFTDFLLILALAVVVEAATPRNHLHRMIVGLFLLLAAAVLTDSVLYALPMAAMLWFLWRGAACLYGLDLPGGDLPAVPVVDDLRWLAGAGLIAALLFLVLPRFEFHSLLSARQPQLRTSGFSDRVMLGDFARQPDRRVVMRIESAQPDESPEAFRQRIAARYWRGVALTEFTGHGWRMGQRRWMNVIPVGRDALFSQSEERRQSGEIAIYREASDHAYLHLPDNVMLLRGVSELLRIDRYGALSFTHPPARRMRLTMQLTAESTEAERLSAPLSKAGEQSNIPAALRSWVAQNAGIDLKRPGDRKRALMQLNGELRTWAYDLNVAIADEHPIAAFLHNMRGHCELFATTLALAARQLGFASRVVNGYYGGEWNEMGGFLLIRRQHAHSWVEVWIDDQWLRLDPTPAARWSGNRDLFGSMDQAWETVKLTWFRYVLGFESSDRGHALQWLQGWLRQIGFWLLPLLALSIWLWRGKRLGLPHPGRPPVGTTQLCAMLDRWLRSRGGDRAMHQPYRGLPVPDGVEPAQWTHFIGAWEAQIYGEAPRWRRRDLRRHLRALLQHY